ncbi:MAG: hypothetical protein HY258_10295 [Chloroflexi bacterium]|nr:hypothetical protein [Chloroflexota bacterium]
MPAKTINRESRIQIHDDLPQDVRSGGESRPFEYPHLYRIQAGDWRISYAVEHNRLAILVLEVLHPEEPAKKDPTQEQITQTVKIKLLDLPAETAPAEIESKIRVKLLDTSDDTKSKETMSRSARESQKIKLSSSASLGKASEKGKITLVDVPVAEADEETESDATDTEPKVTPLNSPSK